MNVRQWTGFVVLLSTMTLGCGRDGTPPSSLHHLHTATTSAVATAQGPDVAQRSYSIKVTAETIFKARRANSRDLPKDQVCGLPQGLHLAVFEAPTVEADHWFVKIKGNPQGCRFSEGYIFEQHAVVPELAIANYRLPIPGSVVTSSWCNCRNIGTSPHIGLDLARSGSMRSYALANGYVQNVTFNGGCGWEVTYRDDGGAVWLYRHLNEPPVRRGQYLGMGALIGSHGSYPTSGCGSGPHLHLERLTSGGFGDKSAGRSCQYGYSSCNYDPRTPFRTGDPKALSLGVQTLEPASTGLVMEQGMVAAKPLPDGSSGCQNFQSQATLVAPKLQADLLAFRDHVRQTEGSPTLLVPNFEARSAGPDRLTLSWRLALASDKGEPLANRCGPVGDPKSSESLRCLVGYEIYLEGLDGKLFRVAAEQNVRNLEPAVSQDARFCVQRNLSGRVFVRAHLDDGRALVAERLFDVP